MPGLKASSLYSRRDLEIALCKRWDKQVGAEVSWVAIGCHPKDADSEYVKGQVAGYKARGYEVEVYTQDKAARKGGK